MGAEEPMSTTATPRSLEPVTVADEPDRGARDGRISRRRLIGVDVLIGVTTLLLVVGIFATWANRLLFSPDNWSKTSTQLLQDAERALQHGELPRRSALRQRQRRRR